MFSATLGDYNYEIQPVLIINIIICIYWLHDGNH